jgi:uncharacterized protein (UPF0333 family)
MVKTIQKIYGKINSKKAQVSLELALLMVTMVVSVAVVGYEMVKSASDTSKGMDLQKIKNITSKGFK